MCVSVIVSVLSLLMDSVVMDLMVDLMVGKLIVSLLILFNDCFNVNGWVFYCIGAVVAVEIGRDLFIADGGRRIFQFCEYF
mmetsp:Transcript_16538/g.18864  ORF Transcript_16538/g.18864 Transcript_16538/m.18864 type:complete len:81 (-) Transcript_16538:308-550(-)